MKRRTIKIAGDNAEDARVRGAAKLGLVPDEVSVEPAGEKQFAVTEKDLPTQVEIFVSPDKMSATIKSISPPRGNSPVLSTEDIGKALAEYEVISGIKKTIIEQLVAELSEAPEVKKNILIAEGTPAEDGEDAKIVFKTGDNAENKNRQAGLFVKPGQVIAEVTPPTKPINGTDVLGKEIKAQNGKPCDVKAGKNVTLSEDKTCFTADMYGIVEPADKTISVKEPLTVSDDKMSADLTICPRLSDNSPLELEDIFSLLDHAGIVHGILNDNIEAALDSDQPVQTTRAAEGTPPSDGKDAKIVFKTGDNAENKNRQAGLFVKPGQVIAEVTPPTKPINGTDVLGKEIKAQNGKPCDVKAGKNVTLSEDKTCFTADMYGIVEPADKTISVKEPLTVSDDKMSADLTICPRLSDNSPLELEDIFSLLDHAGIVHGILNDNIEAALQSDQPVQTTRVVEGTPPKDGKDASLNYYFRLSNYDPEEVDSMRKEDGIEEGDIQKEIFSEGELIAEKIPPVPSEDGCTVYGKAINANKPKDRQLIVGEGVKLSENGLQYIVDEEAMGYANLSNDTLFMESPIRISEDRLHVHVVVHSPSKSDRLLNNETIKERLEWLGIKQGIDEDAVQEVQEKAYSKSNTVHEILIAKGKAPQNGNDAWFEFLFQKEKQAGQYIDDTGRMDFKERRTIQNAKTGDVIAQKVLLTSGEDGFDVFGKMLNAEPGRDWNLIPIEGVCVSEDGRTYKAETDGMITLIGEDRIGILDAYKIAGDVDFSTGNLNMDGSLIINGWVKEGFSVKARGDIFIGEGVENAVIRCGANLKVNRGILGRGKCFVIAKGDVISDFIESTRVNAGENIFVKNSIVRSMITSKGCVDVTSGKGRIMGGTVYALKGVTANEIGTETGTETIIKVGRVPKTFNMMTRDKKYLASLRKNSRRVNYTMGSLVKKSKTVTLGQEERIMLEKLKKLKRRTVKLESRDARYKQILKKELDEYKDTIEVDIKNTVHEGTIIIVHGYVFKVTQQLKGNGKFVLNTETQVVEFE